MTAFDTDVLVWYFRGSEKAKALVRRTARPERLIPSVVYMELVQGCRNRAEIDELRRFVRENFDGGPAHLTEAISVRALRLLEAHSLARGLRVADALIAGTALEAGAVLHTANVKHYRIIDGLTLRPFSP
ncbi:MAG: type II toxin-antitoxin system VapC family toxin [Candidatus Binatia bacterium]